MHCLSVPRGTVNNFGVTDVVYLCFLVQQRAWSSVVVLANGSSAFLCEGFFIFIFGTHLLRGRSCSLPHHLSTTAPVDGGDDTYLLE